jgi:DNA-binding transcriptional MerR regulator
METFITGTLAKRAKVNLETIRFYERRGPLSRERVSK